MTTPNHHQEHTVTDDQHPRGGGPMLDRALADYGPPRTTTSILFGGSLIVDADPDHEPGNLGHSPDPLLEVLAEALAASYGASTFATAGALLLELEARGLRITR